VDQSGATEASAVAHINGRGTPRTKSTTLSGGSYFPLAVGNTWVYQYSDRVTTSSYLVNTITGTQTIDGQTYFTLYSPKTRLGPPTTLMLLGGDDKGVTWQNTGSGDQIYLDPGTTGVQQTGYSGSFGGFSDAIMPPPTLIASLTRTSLIFVRASGLVNSQSILLEGSGGGLAGGYDLVDVQVDGVHLSVPAPALSLSVESATLDLTNKLAPNCAVRCYFAACGLAPALTRPTLIALARKRAWILQQHRPARWFRFN
jgi:hypothetical protein